MRHNSIELMKCYLFRMLVSFNSYRSMQLTVLWISLIILLTAVLNRLTVQKRFVEFYYFVIGFSSSKYLIYIIILIFSKWILATLFCDCENVILFWIHVKSIHTPLWSFHTSSINFQVNWTLCSCVMLTLIQIACVLPSCTCCCAIASIQWPYATTNEFSLIYVIRLTVMILRFSTYVAIHLLSVPVCV